MSLKINYKGFLHNESERIFSGDNSAFLYGDAVFETLNCINERVLLLEEHYFNLMRSMRIYRMNIPMNYTMEFFENEIKKTLKENNLQSAMVQISVFRERVGKSLVKSEVSFCIHILNSNQTNSFWNNDFSEIEIFKDFAVNTSFFSGINIHRPEEIIIDAYREENEYQDMILLNIHKRVARSLSGNLFVIKDNKIITPPYSEGATNGVWREHAINKLKKNLNYEVSETEIHPFELSKADELFICKEGKCMQSIHKFRKKEYSVLATQELTEYLAEGL